MKKLIPVISGIGASLAVPAAAFATETGTGTANAAVVGAMTTVANDMQATGTSVLAIALPLLGLAFVVRYGIKLFRAGSGTRG